MRPANPSHQRRRIHGPNVDHARRAWWARHPTPHSIYVDPAAVVERSKAPRRIVDPRVAPRIDISPVPVAIRRPAYDRRVWEPNGSVSWHRPPSTVFVEVFVADHIVGNVATRR